MTLTTNDIRVLRLLLERGPHTQDEITASLRQSTAGAWPALRRIGSLRVRGLVSLHPSSMRPPVYDVTGEGARQLRRADEAAYGRNG